MLGGLGTLVQIGFALAFGVLLDTFIIRPFMVPAFTLLVWREKSGKDVANSQLSLETAQPTLRPAALSRPVPVIPRDRVA
jgi:RND superfamily putative drug exporter